MQQVSGGFASLASGLIVGMIGVLFSISYATLIFQGPLAAFLPAGIGLALFSGIVCRIGVRWLGSSPFVIADIDALPTVLLAISAGAIAGQLGPDTPSETLFLTVVMLLALMTLLTGGALYWLGHFKAGELIRYIPWPVFGGFLAATGCFLIQAAFSVMLGQAPSLAAMLQPAAIIHGLPGVLLGLGLVWMTQRSLPEWVMPVVICAVIGLFHAGLAAIHLPLASAQGWLLGPFPQGALWQPWLLTGLGQVRWSVLPSQMPQVATLVVVSAVAILLNATALELTLKQDLELNQELKAAGIANLISALGGGWVGYHTLGDTSLAYRMSGGSRLTNLVAIGFYGLILVLGPQPLFLVPKFVLGGLLIFLGLSHLKQWLLDSWFSLPRVDYGIVVGIMTAILMLGLLPGIGLGLGVAIARFVFQYSQINPIRHTLSGAHHPSKVARTDTQSRFLQTEGDHICILTLQGCLFFGTAHTLLEQIRQHLAAHPAIRYLILDFARVHGLEASAVLSFLRLEALTQQQQVVLVLTHLTPRWQHQLQQTHGLLHSQLFTDLDQGIAWCEEQLLAQIPWRRQRTLPMALQLEKQWLPAALTPTFMNYLEDLERAAGDILFQQGEPAEALYFLESGQVMTFITLPDGQAHRLRALGAGHLIGAIAFYKPTLYSMSATVEQPAVLYRLSQTAWDRLAQEHPLIANAFQARILNHLSRQLTSAYQDLADLTQ
jgi:SulP family sulfate permease